MPSGKNHDRITFFCIPLFMTMAFILTRSVVLTVLVIGSFLFSGLMFGPDLDIFSIQFKRWGKIRNLWLPYQKVLSHRSFFSHGFLIGTLIRILYLFIFTFLIAIFIIVLLQLIWGFDWNWQKFFLNLSNLIITTYWQEAIAIFIGLELGAMSHYLADGIVSWWNSRLKRKPPIVKGRGRKARKKRIK